MYEWSPPAPSGGQAIHDLAGVLSDLLQSQGPEWVREVAFEMVTTAREIDLAERVRRLHPRLAGATTAEVELEIATPTEPLPVRLNNLVLDHVLVELVFLAANDSDDVERVTVRALRDHPGQTATLLVTMQHAAGASAAPLAESPRLREQRYGPALAPLEFLVSAFDGKLTLHSVPNLFATLQLPLLQSEAQL